MSTIQYKIVGDGENATITAVLNGSLTAISAAHPGYTRIKSYLLGGGTDPETVLALMDIRQHVANRFRALSERVAFDGERVLFDGDPLDTTLSRHLVRLLREDRDVRPVVNFLEKLATNPSRLSKIHLWTWLTDRAFTITASGDVIGYKGVQSTQDNLSIASGTNPVRVNGRVHTGHVPNPVGARVEIPRSQVDPSRDHGCSTGLHVGTWDYARNWAATHGGRVLTVAVNPRDVVAVPRDCEYAKMRVCGYTVLDVTDVELDTALYADPDEDSDEDPDYFGDDLVDLGRVYDDPAPDRHTGAVMLTAATAFPPGGDI